MKIPTILKRISLFSAFVGIMVLFLWGTISHEKIMTKIMLVIGFGIIFIFILVLLIKLFWGITCELIKDKD